MLTPWITAVSPAMSTSCSVGFIVIGSGCRARDLLGTAEQPALGVDVLEGRAEDRLDSRDVPGGDGLQPARLLGEDVGARPDARAAAERSSRLPSNCRRRRSPVRTIATAAGTAARASTIANVLAFGRARSAHMMPPLHHRLLRFVSNDATKGSALSGDWGSVLTELIPLALVVALSPLSIIPAVLVLHTPRPRPTGLAFLAGWLLGLAGVDGHLPRGVQPARRPR